MPLPMPRLDTRKFDQLVEDGTALLPRLAPGWTDYNLHDPGITLMELLAWLVEMDMYRLDRTSQAAFRAFLRLVGIELRPPSVAESVLVFGVKDNTQPISLPSIIQVANQDGSITFQASRTLIVSPAKLESVLSGSEDSLNDCSSQNQPSGKGIAPLGADPQPGAALYLGFDKPPTIKNTDEVSLYVWTNSAQRDAELADHLIREYELEQTAMDACEYHAPCPPVDWRQHYSARTQWEYFVGAGRWNPLLDVTDETRGLTLSGAVRFKMPLDPPLSKGAVLAKAGQYFIRCKLVSGYYECPPQIQMIAINTIPARHAQDIDVEEKQNDGNGRSGQSFQLKKVPVVPGSTRLRVQVNGQDETWQEVPNWDQVRAHDWKYVLSAESGQIFFGDGLHGRVPQSGGKIAVLKYRKGGGVLGNVGANTLTNYLGSEKVEVLQPFAAFGGAQAETLIQAKGRAIEWLSEPQRAVTLADFEYLARAIPGVPVQRAQAIPNYHPALPGLPALGSLTLVVLPGCSNPIPEPGADMLRSVEGFLNPRRTLTTELHVIGPGFVTLGVRAVLHAGSDKLAGALGVEAQSSLNTFLDPQRGGTDGQGWPFGRDVYESEIMALLNAIPGVDYVDEVGLQVQSRLDVYQGYITWMQVFEFDGSTTVLRAQLRGELRAPASRLTALARLELESYFQSPRGKSKHISKEARRKDVINVLGAISGVASVEDVKLETRTGEAASCGNVPLCAHQLVVSGRHQISVSGARKAGSLRAVKPDC